MARHYRKRQGGRKYMTYSAESMNLALADIKNGLSVTQAARRYKIPRQTIVDRLSGKHTKKPGGQLAMSSEEEAIIVDVINELASWSYPITKLDVRIIIKDYLNKIGKNIKIFKSNMPGKDFIDNFVKRNNLTQRIAHNITRTRYEVSEEQILMFFENIKDELQQVLPENLFNFDETNFTDDPGSSKVLVSKGVRRIEKVMDHSKVAISTMFCISASGDILPPFIVYKAKHIYENWCAGGPPGAKYSATKSEWFDNECFESWFMDILLPLVKNRPGKKILIGDNLASHFSAKVIQLCKKYNIYFTTIPPNATHLMQPLDVAFFRPLKAYWRNILETWRKESRKKGSLPKEVFPTLLSQLYRKLKDLGPTNAKSGFKKCGLYPYNPDEVLKMLPGYSNKENISAALNASVLEFLEQQQGSSSSTSRLSRGRKIIPGLPLHSRTSTALQRDNGNEDCCAICKCNYNNYRGPDWLQCVFCNKWICGFCNNRSKDPRFTCEVCIDEE